MSIDTRFTPAIRNALLEQMQDVTGKYTPDGGNRAAADEDRSGRVASDSVSISADALRVHASIEYTAGQDVYAAARVAEIKQEIATGIYNIDPARIADKFYQFNIRM
jgi:flagellar biosynthesis anti-sigma factor FlgM